MAGDTLRAPDGADSDRLDTLRQSLSGFLARFTADRDALITTVQECEQRLEEVAARVEANHTGGQHTTGGAGPMPQLDDLKQALERLESNHREAETRTQMIVERVNDAVAKIDALTAMQAAHREASPTVPALTATVSVLTQRVDALRAEIQEIRQSIEPTRKEPQSVPAMPQPAVRTPRTNV
jgi:chromosome segregation ATPase